MTYAQKFAYLLRESRYTYTAFARALRQHNVDVTYETVSNWAQGRNDIPTRAVVAICRILDVRPDHLLLDEYEIPEKIRWESLHANLPPRPTGRRLILESAGENPGRRGRSTG